MQQIVRIPGGRMQQNFAIMLLNLGLRIQTVDRDMALHVDRLIITLYFIKQHCGGKSARRLGILNLKHMGRYAPTREDPPAVSIQPLNIHVLLTGPTAILDIEHLYPHH